MRTVFLVMTLILTLGLGVASAQSAEEAAINTHIAGYFAALAEGDATAATACFTENGVRAIGTNIAAGRALRVIPFATSCRFWSTQGDTTSQRG